MATHTVNAHHFRMVVRGGHLFEFYTSEYRHESDPESGEIYLVFGPSLAPGTSIAKTVHVSDVIFLSVKDAEVELDVPEPQSASDTVGETLINHSTEEEAYGSHHRSD